MNGHGENKLHHKLSRKSYVYVMKKYKAALSKQ